MAPVKNGRVVFGDYVQDVPKPGQTTIYDSTQTIDLEAIALNGGILIKTLVVAVDPYLLARFRNSNIPGWSLNKDDLVSYLGVGVVLRSEDPAAKPGDHLYGLMPFQEYTVLPGIGELRVLKNEEKLPWSVYVGIAGMPGQTAWVGWKEYAAPQKGDVVFVSSGAGPVGNMAIQLAKHAGCKVIASAGSDEKVRELRDTVGADVAFNYKTTSVWDVLAKEGPINIYWDNVGAESLDAALQHAATGARFIECGMISQLSGAPYTMKNLFMIVRQEIKLFGFITTTLMPKYLADFYKEVPGQIARGELKYVEDRKHGLELAGEAIRDVWLGQNRGKSVVIVGEE
ncbi:NADP-dependent oxidoreductase [Phanerochaete sordida]|uniref:NADP-dependent oxidoreductase n=1 Tax=Phanerochaete sordida TaxID=48140 RepID=A0A9P3G3P6_9APHY|nr:NADP-dependent oxidoreductase [Phanerochaete sordida]